MVTITASDVSKATNEAVQQLGYSFVKEDQYRVVTGIVGALVLMCLQCYPQGTGIVCAMHACHWSLTIQVS